MIRWVAQQGSYRGGRGLNLYGFVENAPGDDWDWLELCGYACKSVSVTFIPGGKRPKEEFYPLQSPFGTFYQYGFVIKIEWTVDGRTNSCKILGEEPAGGVTGETQAAKSHPPMEPLILGPSCRAYPVEIHDHQFRRPVC
jgi:hypothetical protein